MAGISATMPARNKQYAPNKRAKVREMSCVPLGVILREASVKHVDFFSLDVEGAELNVLRTVDWDAVTFGVLLVEQDGKNTTKDNAVRELLRAKGYEYDGVTGMFCRAEVWLGGAYQKRKALSSAPASTSTSTSTSLSVTV